MEDYIQNVDILDEVKDNFLNYASEVLTDRAIPSAEDGLLSAQRKILWTMEEYLKMNAKGKTKKCASIVGTTLATSYFHGDQACYGVLCKMSLPYLMRYPLIQGQGSLGTQENNDIRASARYCVTGDTYLSTEKGMKKMKDIVPNSIDNSEYDINLTVQGGFGEKRKAVKFFNTGIRDIYKIQLQNGMWIKATPNHPILTLDEELNFKWKLVENLKSDDKVLVSYNTDNSCFGENDNLLEAKMLGCMISEGYTTTQNRIGINNKDINMITPVLDFIKSKIPNNSASICYNDKREYYEYCVASKDFYNYFIEKYEFEKSDGKHLPETFFEGTKEYQSVCLSYLFEGDGSVDVTHGVSYSSISEELIHQLQVVLIQNFGIISTIRRTTARNEIKLCINNVSAPLFQKEIGFVSDYKNSGLQDLVEDFKSKKNISNTNICAIHELTQYVRNHHLPGTSSKRVQKLSFSNLKVYWKAKEFLSAKEYLKLKNIADNYYYLKITSIEHMPSEVAYSIRIDDETHSFIGNGFTNHNTEAKPSIYADLMMNDFKKNVVPLKETYNGEFMEPVVLPSFFPNALCNGKQSIGISMAHGSLPNNLTEVCNGIIAYIKNPEITIDEILNYIPGPDFPLGGTIINKKDIKTAFLTGKSNISLKVRGDYFIKGNQVIFSSLPYRAYRNKIKEQLDKKFEEFEKVLEDFSDESGLGNNRLVFTLKKGINPNQLLNKLFTYTDLQMSLSYNMNYIVNGTPKLCSIKDLIKAYYIHQTGILISAAKFNKSKAETRLNIILGLLIALDKIDTVISIIRSAKDKNEAKEKLMAAIEVNTAQADAILAMKLSQLTKMDKESLLGEKTEKENIIADCVKLIKDKEYRDETLIKKVTEMRDKYGDERRTKLLDLEIPKEEKEIAAIAPEKCVVVMTKSGNIKRVAAPSFKTQNRNGKGVKSQDDIVSAIIRTNTVDQLLVFSNQGKMYKILVDDIPTGTNVSKGTPIASLVKMSDAETPSLIYSVYHETKAKYICLITRNGKIKKTSLEECLNIKKKTGVPVIKINEDDELASVFLLDEEEILVFNENGKCLHTDTGDIAATGRTAQGVKIMEPGILFAMPIRDAKDDVFIVSKDGFGKRASLVDFSKTARTGKGVIIYKPEEHQIAGAAMVNNEDKVLISGSPCSICIDMKSINITGRTATGVGIIKDSEVITISKV